MTTTITIHTPLAPTERSRIEDLLNGWLMAYDIAEGPQDPTARSGVPLRVGQVFTLPERSGRQRRVTRIDGDHVHYEWRRSSESTWNPTTMPTRTFLREAIAWDPPQPAESAAPPIVSHDGAVLEVEVGASFDFPATGDEFVADLNARDVHAGAPIVSDHGVVLAVGAQFYRRGATGALGGQDNTLVRTVTAINGSTIRYNVEGERVGAHRMRVDEWATQAYPVEAVDPEPAQEPAHLCSEAGVPLVVGARFDFSRDYGFGPMQPRVIDRIEPGRVYYTRFGPGAPEPQEINLVTWMRRAIPFRSVL